MAPAAEYLFLSIETLINTISMVVMIPCMITLVRTQGMHGNCKIILITSGSVQSLLLLDQFVLFVYDYAVENVGHYGVDISDKMIFVFFGVEGFTFLVSIFIIIYARHKLRKIPYDHDRLKAKYQITEVFKYSVAILPSVILSVFMHTFSLVPNFLWQYGFISWPECCLFYFSDPQRRQNQKEH
ncbi:hypothetical protein PRIPAC_71638 [Pristionchus pacificus]|uniref:Uncharacterized protein n=1 Tax=Pristionchus pacificus TaxID=54126 RepID=A0A2A6C0P1_PRIPA|nr:hypothetical protein PRIPAC_71638 [Pristionchus pacificus]|eukprot:PDM71583.1 hypothetical protein PRIPAC_37990 [Pristionchus pacificus]